MDFGYLIELVRIPLANLLRVRRDPKDLLAPSEAWIGSLEGLLREKHASFRPIRQLGRQGIPDPFRGQVRAGPLLVGAPQLAGRPGGASWRLNGCPSI